MLLGVVWDFDDSLCLCDMDASVLRETLDVSGVLDVLDTHANIYECAHAYIHGWSYIHECMCACMHGGIPFDDQQHLCESRQHPKNRHHFLSSSVL